MLELLDNINELIASVLIRLQILDYFLNAAVSRIWAVGRIHLILSLEKTVSLKVPQIRFGNLITSKREEVVELVHLCVFLWCCFEVFVVLSEP